MKRAEALRPIALTQQFSGKQEQLNDDPGRQFVTALARGLSVLHAFTTNGALLGNHEIVEITGLTSPTVSRLMYTLTRLGYLSYSPSNGKYRLGTAALALGYWAIANMYVKRIAKPLMEKASQQFNLCCALGYRDETDVVYVEHTRGSSSLILNMEPGSRTPIATTAMGRSLIAVMKDAPRETLMEQLSRRYGDAWPPLKKGIDDSILQYRAQGFTTAAGEWEPEIQAVGVPLSLPDGHEPLALILGGAAYDANRKSFLAELGPAVVQLARQIESHVMAAS